MLFVHLVRLFKAVSSRPLYIYFLLTLKNVLNFQDCRKTARAIQEISQYQDEPFNLTPISYMREALTDLDGGLN